MSLRILFVDDEPKLLEALQRLLRPLRRQWEVKVAEGGLAALTALSEGPFDAIVTDMRMPGMDGAMLLAAVAEQYPDLPRIVLSGQSADEASVKASSAAHQYLQKPCSLEELREAVSRAHALQKLLQDPVLQRFTSYLEFTPAEVDPVVSANPELSSRILQVVNSPHFRQGSFQDPVRAAQQLGPITIRAISLCTPLIAGVDAGEAWTHSVDCGILAGRIAQRLRRGDPELADQSRAAGILHDVGRLLLMSRSPGQYEQVVALANRGALNYWQAEREVYQTSHAEIGASLLAMRDFPDSIVEAVAYHHNPSDCTGGRFSVLTAVHIANSLLSESSNDVRRRYPLDAAYLERVGIVPRIEEFRSDHPEKAQ